jgi:acyl-CoA reductase-like NAD-dependent aldehyde dehydrogenase
VAASAAKTLKRVTLELGGNDAAIVCDDVDIAKAAPQVTALAFLNSGQICCTLKRVYIHTSIYDEFREAMLQAVNNLAVGNGTDNVFCGPIQNSMQYERVQGFFADIEKENQNVICGGQHTDKTGFYINPAIVDNPSPNSRIVVEEPFG